MSISRAAPLTIVLWLLWTATGWAQQSEAAAEQQLARLLGRAFSAAAVDGNGWTDLHYAAALNLPRLATTLLRAGAGAGVGAALKTDREPLSERLPEVLRAVRAGYLREDQ